MIFHQLSFAWLELLLISVGSGVVVLGVCVQLVTNLLNYHNRQVLDTYSLQRAAITSGSPLNSADL